MIPLELRHVSWVPHLGVVVHSLEFPIDLPVSSLSAPPSVRVVDFGGLSLVIHESGCGMFGRVVLS